MHIAQFLAFDISVLFGTLLNAKVCFQLHQSKRHRLHALVDRTGDHSHGYHYFTHTRDDGEGLGKISKSVDDAAKADLEAPAEIVPELAKLHELGIRK